MKKRIIAVFGVVLVLFIAWMGYTSVKKLDKKQTIQERQSDLFEMFHQLGQVDLPVKPTAILIFFNSECEHCQWEMQEISKSIDLFSQHQLLLASFEPEQEAISFLNQYGLSNYYVKSSPEMVMASYTGGVPQTLIYQNGKLTNHFKGEVKVGAVLEVLGEK
ncbi:MAG: hypothetical protein AAF620_15665 [Bacteroidota bacterium]